MYKTATFMRRTSNAVSDHRRRARQAEQTLDYGLDDLRAKVIEALQLPCCYCRCSMTDATFSCDHATPTSRGGSFNLWNVEVVCVKCNQSKGALTHEEFSLLMAALWEMASQGRMNVLARLRAGGKVIGGRARA